MLASDTGHRHIVCPAADIESPNHDQECRNLASLWHLGDWSVRWRCSGFNFAAKQPSEKSARANRSRAALRQPSPKLFAGDRLLAHGPMKSSDDKKALADLIKNRLEDHVTCIVFENKLAVVWPRAYEHDSRIKEIETFAKANGWSVRISDPGIRLTFKKLKG